MTVSTTTSRVEFTLTGSTNSFPFSFKIFAEDDLVVVYRDTSGSETTLVLNTDYTVSTGPWESGGTVTTTTTYTSGTLTIARSLDLTQEVDYTTSGPFPAETHEQALDRLTMICQELNTTIGRSFTLSVGDTSGASLIVPSPVSNNLIGWNSAGTALENKVPTSISPLVAATAFATTLLDDADASEARTTLGAAGRVSGATSGNLASLDANGDLQDSGSSVVDIHAVMPSAHGVLAPHKNLTCQTISTTQYRVQADELVLTDPSTGKKVLVSSVNDAPDITSASDRDGALAIGWWYVWVSSDGTNVQAWHSQSSTAPTDPYGYAYRGLVGAVYETTGSGNLRGQMQIGNEVHLDSNILLATTSSTAPLAINLTNYAPAESSRAYLHLTATSPAAAGQYAGYVRARSNGPDYLVEFVLSTGAVQSAQSIGIVPLLAYPSVYCLVSEPTTTAELRLNGFCM